MKDIYDELVRYCNDDFVPMHMPGHKRNSELFVMDNPYKIDITEIDGFDNLHNPQNILLNSMKKTADLYKADHTYYLVNGSSAGILASICGLTQKGDKVLVARNCHKSVYNAIYLNELYPIYLYSQDSSELRNKLGIYGAIKAGDVEKQLAEQKDISAVIITSPTYEGIVSDIRGIAEITRRYQIPLIVDEAHGAHFVFSEEFPDSAVVQGADIVINSIHKTLPAFTQTALLHVRSGLAAGERIEHYLDIFQSTSPSYILMAGIDRCMNWLEEYGKEAFGAYIADLKKLRAEIAKLKYIKLLQTDDISKIILYTERDICSLNGKQLYDILLDKYHIQLEMASEHYVIAMTSVADKKEYYNKFLDALRDFDQEASFIRGNQSKYVHQDICTCSVNNVDSQQDADISSGKCGDVRQAAFICKNQNGDVQQNVSICDSKNGGIHKGNRSIDKIKAVIDMSIYKAVNMQGRIIRIQDAEGLTSGVCICIYPPGIPVINPGERITQDIIAAVMNSIDTGLQVIGITEYEGKEVGIKCLR